MAKEEKMDNVLKEHKISGKLVYKSVDGITVNFSMEDKGQMGNRNIQFPADVIPKEFDPTIHEITGSYTVKFEVKEK